jgi:hypothetical protein
MQSKQRIPRRQAAGPPRSERRVQFHYRFRNIGDERLSEFIFGYHVMVGSAKRQCDATKAYLEEGGPRSSSAEQAHTEQGHEHARQIRREICRRVHDSLPYIAPFVSQNMRSNA